MNNKQTRLNRVTELVHKSKYSSWCLVNTENEFNFMGNTYKIDESVEEYKVYKKAGEVEDYTNEAYMEQVLVVDDGMVRHYYNQECNLIDSKLISMI